MCKRNRPIAGVGTDRHKEAIRAIASRDKVWPPSESKIVCASVMFTFASIESGALTIEDLFTKYDLAVLG